MLSPHSQPVGCCPWAALPRKQADDLIFTSPLGKTLRLSNWRKAIFDPACQAAEIEGLRPHDLRHAAERCSRLIIELWMIQNGQDPHKCALCGKDSERKLTMRHTKFAGATIYDLVLHAGVISIIATITASPDLHPSRMDATIDLKLQHICGTREF
jgi:hypothetical protein